MIAPTSFFGDYGCHVRILEEAQVLQQMGQKVTIVTYHRGRDVDGLDIRRTLPIPWRINYEVGSSRHKVGFDALLALTTARAMMGERPDVIHAHLHEGALIGYAASRLWGVPLVFDFQGSLTGEMIDHHFLQRSGFFYDPLYRLEGFLDRHADAVVTSSHHATQLLQSEFHCPAAKVETVPDCVNTDWLAPRPRDDSFYADRAALGLPPDAPVIVYLGLLAEYQGLPQLLEAARILRQTHPTAYFLIMGYPAVDVYRHKAYEMGIGDRVVFSGRVPYSEAPRRLGLGDIAAAPKLSTTEGCGKILNYMAMALPTVAFDTPVSCEYLGPYGVYAQERSGEALAAALSRLLDMPDRGAAIGQRLRERVVRQYPWSRAGAVITAVYDRVLRRSS
jgi:glycosyltransferase involved in cell wall biosynthesis